MKLWIFTVLGLVLWNRVTWAFMVEITEISPHKIGTEEEWFEFLITPEEGGELIDMTNWEIRNEKGTIKYFKDFPDQIETVLQDRAPLLEEEFPFKISISEPQFFAWKKSPLSLPNGGATIVLQEEEVVFASQVYPKAKSGSKEGKSYAEVLNSYQGNVYPLVRVDDDQDEYTHTKGSKNKELPTPIQELDIRISEVGPNRVSGGDFIEIYIGTKSNNPVNLKYVEVKANGKTLWNPLSDFWVEPHQFIVIESLGNPVNTEAGAITIKSPKLAGLSAGSGTIELYAWSGTSLESRIDTVCYMNEKLSETEGNRVSKNRKDQDWFGECIDIANIKKNESLARENIQRDSNTKSDWIRHFNGSPGASNEVRNEAPVALIEVQGSGKIYGEIPYFLNLTGAGSSDPDGAEDFSRFEWYLNGERISDKLNPPGFYITKSGKSEIQFTVTDSSGASNTKMLQVEGYKKIKMVTLEALEEQLKKEMEVPLKKKEIQKELEPEVKTFASEFIAKAPETFWETVTDSLEPNIPERHFYQNMTARQKIAFFGIDKKLHPKNLGVIFLPY